MPGSVEAATALYLYNAEPLVGSIASRPTQRREFRVRKWGEQVEVSTFIESSSSVDSGDESGRATGSDESPVNELSALTEADEIVAELCRFEQLTDDWDGNGAARPIVDSLRQARRFIRALHPRSALPMPALHADGHTALLLRHSDSYAELEFLGDNKIGYYVQRGGREWGDEIYFDGGTLPEELLQLGLKLERQPQHVER